MTAPAAPARAHTTDLTAPAALGLRQALIDELAAHEAHAADHRDAADALAGEHDSDSVLEREVAEHAAARSLEAVAEVRLALQRLDDGSYGRCERCGSAISDARLEAIPHARHCVGCPAPPRLT